MIDDYDVTDITNRVVDQASDKIYQNLIDWIEEEKADFLEVINNLRLILRLSISFNVLC